MHVNPDLLALLALDESVGSPEEHAHLASCSECRAEWQSLRAAVAVGRRTSDEDAVTTPPPHVWQRIREELQLQDSAPAPVVMSAGPPSPPVDVTPPGPDPAAPVPSRRSVRAAAFVLAAALALVVGIGIGTNLDRFTGGDEQVASVQLNALPPWAGSSGRAVVERDRDGHETLVVQISTPQAANGPREVWMTNSSAEPMLAMGYLTGDEGRFPIPPGMDVTKTPLVDISQEPPNDSNPDHSGRSMLRGKLPL